LGALDSDEELAFIRTKIAAGEEPWASEFTQIRNMAGPGTGGVSDGNGGADNAAKAYANALVWHYTGNVQYADNAIAILNEWANTFNGYVVQPASQPLLVAAWTGSLLGPASELMRNYTGWSPAAQAKMKAMFIKSFYPPLNLMSTWNGNVDLTQIDAMLSIATFNEDKTEFDAAIARFQLRSPAYFYLASDNPAVRNYGGSNDAAWSQYNAVTIWADGLSQESCRDWGHHAQFAIGAALSAAEIAWHQGVDIYAAQEKRYVAAIELMSLQLLTGKMQGTCAGNNGNTNTNRFNTLEIGFNHYHNRMNIPMPQTEAYLATTGSKNGQNQFNLFFETLTHHGIIIANDPPTSIVVSPAVLAVPLAGTATATAVVAPTTASQKVTWTSRDATIVTVNANGVVTGVALGSTYVDATTLTGNIVGSTYCTVTKIDVTGVTVTPNLTTIALAATSQLVATLIPANASNKLVTWKSSDITVATVSATGLVTALKEGTAIITVTTVEGSFTATASITVTANPNLLSASKTPLALTIDGTLDESVWKLDRTIEKPVIGIQNNTEIFGVLWDNTYLYIGVKVLDATLITTNANVYDNDAVELYFDMNNNGGVYDASDRSWIKVINRATIWEKVGVGAGLEIANSTVKSATQTIAGGYTMELAIPWTNLNVTPNTTSLYGFDIVIDDADAAPTRTNQSVWIGTMDNWTNLTAVGDLKLLDLPVTPTPVTQTISLIEGWNLISTNVVPTDNSIATLFAALDVQEIKTADNFWLKGQNAAFNNLNTIEAGKGYLVKMNVAGNFVLSGTPISTVAYSPTNTLTTGWNLIGCSYQTATAFSTYFTATNTQTIKNFEGFWEPTNGALNSIVNLEPGKAYYLKQ
jgi:uncharacterized protein YjdB